ncbi:SMC-Scp complex subunit ScpB [Enterovirga sp. DB1703]|uniref:SMC-Scp complex subunit ScpB n=1 Tax=Enterovirga aerilata TaxID=2730920 RepID=A0A849IBG1_9HYPH|nr:SMC-Scp complex subunit ScpB [Enterovirga sp. DB1703]
MTARRALTLAVDNLAERGPVQAEAMRIAEAVLFAAPEPVGEQELAARLPAGADAGRVLADLERAYAGRGVNLVRVEGKWAFRTAADLAFALAREAPEPQKLSRAAMEVLAIIAYHQPTTRAEIEEIRGVTTSKGTLDVLLETGWIRMRGRRKSPGRPVTFGTTAEFLRHFGLNAITDLPGLEELQGLGLLEGKLPGDLVPVPSDDTALDEDEEPLDLAAMALGPVADETE